MSRKSIAEIERRRAEKLAAESTPASAPSNLPFAFAIVDPRLQEHYPLSVNQLRTLIWNRELPAQMNGKKITVLREDLERHLRSERPLMEHTNSAMLAHLDARDDGKFAKPKRPRSGKKVAA